MKNWTSIPFIRIISVVVALFLFYYLIKNLIFSFDSLCGFDRCFVCISLIFIPLIFIYLLIASYSKDEQLCKRRKCISDIVNNAPYVVRPVVQNIFHSFFSRPAGGLTGLILASLITVCILVWTPTFDWFITGLGISGVIFGILSYHVSQRVEHSIRDSIVDFREFLKIVSHILDDEIICEKRRIKKFVDSNGGPDDDVPDCADLILLLWLPSYNFTKDFKGIGEKLDKQLQKVKALSCRSYLISAKDESQIIRFFDGKYRKESKNYDEDILSSFLNQVDSNLGQLDSNSDKLKKQILESIFAKYLEKTNRTKLDRKNVNLSHSLNNLYSLREDKAFPFWSIILEDNDTLMDRLIQLIWTPKKAAIVFMPPDHALSGCEERDNNSADMPVSLYTSRSPYKCSGFVTEDTFMISMIRDIIQLQYKV